jgi:hypothetical protein
LVSLNSTLACDMKNDCLASLDLRVSFHCAALTVISLTKQFELVTQTSFYDHESFVQPSHAFTKLSINFHYCSEPA